MATNYPTDLDTFDNPSASDKLDSPSHSKQHADVNDAVEALEAKVGKDGSSDTSSHDYKLSGIAGTAKAFSTADVIDEDDMASDSDEKVPTQQSVKAYVDNNATSDWNSQTDVIPTRTSADDPTYVIQFAGVDLTSKVSVGQKISWVQNGSTRYGFITALSVSGGNTSLTLYGGTDYDVDDTSTYAISEVKFSSMKAPYGFPLDPDKWSEITVYTNYLLDTTTTDDTWQELDDSVNLTIPIGKWKVHLSASIAVEFSGGSWQGCTSTLSTTTNSETNPEFTGIIYPYTSGTGWIRDKAHTLDNIIDLTTKTTFYFLVNPQPRNGGSTVNVRYYGNAYPFHIKATIAYL